MEKGLKWTKKVENSWKKVVQPAFGCAHISLTSPSQFTDICSKTVIQHMYIIEIPTVH